MEGAVGIVVDAIHYHVLSGVPHKLNIVLNFVEVLPPFSGHHLVREVLIKRNDNRSWLLTVLESVQRLLNCMI